MQSFLDILIQRDAYENKVYKIKSRKINLRKRQQKKKVP